jgi:hypothetical protein
MLIKIKRQECLDKYPKFPQAWYNYLKEDIEYFYPNAFDNFVLTLESKSFKGHSKLLGIELTKLINLIGYNNLIFLGDANTAWLYQDSDYKPVKEALQFLTDNRIGKKFNGAIQIDITTLPIFIQHLSWLSRCNAALPSFYFSDAAQNIIGTICQYGNLHITTINKKTNTILKDLIAKTKFNYLTDSVCYNQFSKSSKIKGRQVKY